MLIPNKGGAALVACVARRPRLLPSTFCVVPAVFFRNQNCRKLDIGAARFSSAARHEELAVEEVPPYSICHRAGVRNVAIVAHVDHGKTTLVDELLKVANKRVPSFTAPSVDDSSSQLIDSSNLNRLMDSGELEIERGITITSKITRLDYASRKGEPVIINVVDTPGHADFAGEVDRVLGMVDGVCLVVDAAEGPMAQTKYVLSRALSLGLNPFVVLNKVDREDAIARIESGETESQLLDLFDSLGANDEQMDYVTLYASARDGWVTDDADVSIAIGRDGLVGDRTNVSMNVLLDAVLKIVPEPSVRSYDENSVQGSHQAERFFKDKFSLAATSVGYDQFLGRTCTGRIYSGSVSLKDSIVVLSGEETDLDSTCTGLFVNRGISRVPLEPPVASAGDIITLTGVPDSIAVGDTVTGAADPVPLPIETPPVAPPLLSMDFGANTGPLAGAEGTILTSSRIKSRLVKEADNNVTVIVEASESDSEKSVVYARGELQLGVLIEQMRREGYELLISPPRIVTKTCPDTKKKLEPFEEVTVDVDAEHAGTVVNALTGKRKGVLVELTENIGDGKQRLLFEVPSRGLLGFGPEIATATRGTAVVHHCFTENRPYAGLLCGGLENGKIVSSAQGKASPYGLSSAAERGTLFIQPGDLVYPGMVIGENSRPGDIEVNPVKAKASTNVRTVLKDESIRLAPPKRMTVEELIGYMNDDEVIEVTPKSIRLRKAELDSSVRQRAARSKKKQLKADKERQCSM